MKYKLVLVVAPLAALLSFNYNIIEPAYFDSAELSEWDNGAPASKTGAPGENTCTQCHAGSTMSASGVVSTLFNNGLSSSYVPGQTYDVTISASGSSTNGFQMTSLNTSDLAAGDFIPGTNSKLTTGGGKRYINHSASSGISSWTFQWTAPAAGEGDVTFYYAYNRTNANGSTSGDEIFLGDFTVTEASTVGVSNLTQPSPKFVVSNGSVNLDYNLKTDKRVYLSVQTLEGKMAFYNDFGVVNSGRQLSNVNLPMDLKGGIYIITLFIDNQGYSEKVFIQ